MQISKFIWPILFLCLFLSPAQAQEIKNLIVRNVQPKVSTDEYIAPYVENNIGQAQKTAKVPAKFNLFNFSITYQLYLPKGYTSKRHYPLIILLHGAGRTGKSVVERWKDLADEVGLILVGPNAYNKHWMDGGK